jgi:protein involved in polysaccharide export with SLBB domain/uncharacterized protein involved in exopolysaccharide biosynthesis
MERWAERQEVVSLQWLAHALRRQWKWVATGVAVGIALALGIVLFGERRYEAEAKILVETPTGMGLGAGGTLASLVGGGSPDLNTQAEVLTARPLLEKVQQDAGIDEPYRDFAKRFRATPVRNTNIVQITASDSTADGAQRLAQLWAQNYLEYVRTLYEQNPSTLIQKLSRELDNQEQRLQTLSQRLTAFLKRRQMVAPEQELTKAVEKYADLLEQARNLEAQRLALERQIDAIQNELQRQPRFYEATRNLAIPPEVQQLNTKIAELEIQRSGLLQEFQPSAPEVKILEEQIAQAKREREQILARAVDQQFLTLAKQEAVNPVYQDLLKGLLEARSNLQATEASLAVVGRQQAQFEQLFRQTPDTMAEYAAEASVRSRADHLDRKSTRLRAGACATAHRQAFAHSAAAARVARPPCVPTPSADHRAGHRAGANAGHLSGARRGVPYARAGQPLGGGAIAGRTCAAGGARRAPARAGTAAELATACARRRRGVALCGGHATHATRQAPRPATRRRVPARCCPRSGGEPARCALHQRRADATDRLARRARRARRRATDPRRAERLHTRRGDPPHAAADWRPTGGRYSDRGGTRMRAIWGTLFAFLAATLVAQPADYTLDTGDVISVVVLRHGQFSGEYTVPPDGNVVFPGVGNLQVRGQTLQGLADTLRERLSQRLRNPEVFVSLKQARPQLVFVEGQVNSPGPLAIQSDWRVAEAVVSAGGLRTLPERAIGTLIRGEEKYPINLADIFHRGDNRTNYLLQPGDLISIQAKETLRVAVIGEVQTTGFLNVPNDARLADAIAQAGGLTGAAALRRAYIDRKGEIIPLDLYRTFVLGDLQGIHNPPLQEGDVIVVPKNMRRYAIVGQVNQPGYYGIREGQPFLLSDAIALAGGVNNRAITSRITILRVEDGAVRKVVVPYQRFLKKGDLEANPVIQDGDVIYIAEATKLDLGTIFGAVSLLNLFNQLGISR